MADKSPPPLVTSRSPSYERARQERAHPAPPGAAEAIALFGRLVEAEQDAAAAVRAAGRPDAAAEHEARAASLGALIAQAGGSAPRPEESRRILSTVDALDGAADIDAAQRAVRDELAGLYAEAARDPVLGDEQRRAVLALAPR